MNEQIEWCLGFCFNEVQNRVVVIKKNRGPEFLIGKWNAIGGRLKKGEAPLIAMVREFREETGVRIPEWSSFGKLEALEGVIHLFSITTDDAYDVETKEDELVDVIHFNAIDFRECVANFRWLLQMALVNEQGLDRCKFFTIREAI
jgi:8-oxo-dGTP pyrophosphatase MutT (NUDIX family)